MKRALYAAMMCAAAGASLSAAHPVEAAAFIQVTMVPSTVRPSAALEGVGAEPASITAAIQGPVNLIPPQVRCTTGETARVCAVRTAAARRAAEVVGADDVAPRFHGALSLLIPEESSALFIPVRAINCDPSLTVEQCERLDRQAPQLPQGPLPPSAPTPPLATVPTDPAVRPVSPPVVADPPSVIPTPRTGDGDIIRRPPLVDPEMPVVKPRPNPPVTTTPPVP